jgi:signal transduction histidine kinase
MNLVEIRDTGIGIPPENTSKLFQPLFSTKSGRMGMGLWISRSIVEAHGGTLWFTPGEDLGSTFHFTLRERL